MKILKSFQDHFIILFFSNFLGLINLIFALLILYAGSPLQYNNYTVYASLFSIFLVPSKIFKGLATTYGKDLFLKIKSIIYEYKKKLPLDFILFIFLFTLVILLENYINGEFFIIFFVLLASISQIFLQLFIGIFQNQRKFLISSLVLTAQNFFKIITALILFFLFSNLGIWFAFFITSLITNLFLIKNFPVKKNKYRNKFFTKDLLINLFLLMSLELLFNSDALIASNKLSIKQAHVYNSLIIIKKSLFFSVFGISQIILSQSRKTGVNKLSTLIKNLGITMAISAIAGIFLILFEKPIFQIIKLENIYSIYYLKFIFSSILFSCFYMIGSWFSCFKNQKIRILLSAFIIIFVIYYAFSITNLENIFNTLIFGNIALILIELLLIIAKKFKII